MPKKKICWITAGYFLQVDLPILKYLNEEFDIRWFVYAKENSDAAQHALAYAKQNNIHISIFSNKYNRLFPWSYIEDSKQIKKIRNINADLYYFDISAFPYLIFAIKKHLPSNKVIMAMHHGKIHNGMRFKHIYGKYLHYLNRQNFWFQYFSNSQAKYFIGNKNQLFIIPLALNDFGKATAKAPNNCVTFLSFGHIIETKNIGLLIKAACKLKEITEREFKVRIVGNCRLWNELYQPLIKYPEIFDLHIQSIPDREIPNLFASSHFLVLPYNAVTQSGPLRIAFGYNVPVIASDLDGFKESVKDGTTGLLFKNNDVDSLVSVMKRMVDEFPNSYNYLRQSQQDYVKKFLSNESIVKQYIQMFNRILNDEN